MTAAGSPLLLRLPTREDTQRLGRTLGSLLRAGDVLVLTGDLGAGKTTLTQGIGDGLGVRGPVTSPTFVIARIHPSLGDGPELVHVDAYRLGSALELDDLDLDTELSAAVTVIEWGAGLAEGLADERLELTLTTDADPDGALAADPDAALAADPDGSIDPGRRSAREGEGAGDAGRTARVRGVGARGEQLVRLLGTAFAATA